MPKVAYIANQFPAAVEWYVVDEILTLRRRGVEVIPWSARKGSEKDLPPELRGLAAQTMTLQPLRWTILFHALWMCGTRFGAVRDLLARVVLRGDESLMRRIRALAHTWLGAYYALRLRDHDVEHIHAHHGYFASWIALVAARFLGISFSMTLHGSDLLVHASFMDTKLSECSSCWTVSEFNRRHILAHYPNVDGRKIAVRRMGVDIPAPAGSLTGSDAGVPLLLAVGRLHRIKDHAFLLRACALLRQDGLQFRCLIVGDGPERRSLQSLIRELKLKDAVTLAGPFPHSQIPDLYRAADLVVLTSRSEGIPLVLMEAMAHGKIVLAPAITGIPELVIDGKTGFLYRPGSLADFAQRARQLCGALHALQPVRRCAREHVRAHFNRRTNLEQFADLFLESIGRDGRSCIDENPVLQQI